MILYFLLAHLTAESGALMISEILGKVIRTPLPQCRFQVSTLIPKTPLIVYAGTGDRDVTSRTHRGVIKSIDGGISWNISNSGMGNVVVGKMIVDPAHPDTILAATSGGIYKSTNGAVSWTRKGSGSGYKDIEAAPKRL